MNESNKEIQHNGNTFIACTATPLMRDIQDSVVSMKLKVSTNS